MARRPTVFDDQDNWGTIDNEWCLTEHDNDGTHGSITPASVVTGTITASGTASTGALTSTSLSTGGITATGAVSTGALTPTSISTSAITATGAIDLGAGTLEIPNSADVSANTGEGLLSWESDRDLLFVGDGAAVQQITRYVDRGDPAAVDFAVGDLTTDNSQHDLDLSSIVPAGAVAVNLRVVVGDENVNTFISFRKKGNSNNINKHLVRVQISNLENDGDFIVACDANRKIQYLTSNVTFTTIDIIITGWWL